jgi:SAM-dependent methyltransferase
LSNRRPNFDFVARPYRWLEYLTLGHALERCRFHFLPQLQNRTRALVLGDGDGRFTARLLQINPRIHADAVDISPAMLQLLRQRCQRASPSTADRLKTHHADAFAFLATPSAGIYDLVVSHFFLDCFTQPELAQLIGSIVPHLAPGALWLVSDFRISSGAMRLPARLLVRFLYIAFRALTGLRVTQLPDHETALSTSDFVLHIRHRSLLGMLTTELWSIDAPPEGDSMSLPTETAADL